MADAGARVDRSITAACRITRDGSMDPLGTLIISLGTLIVIDLAALQLGGSRRPRPRVRPARPR
jgi:hypothetical protein